MTNKKKQSSQSDKARRQGATKASEAEQQQNKGASETPQPSGKTAFAPPQMRVLIFLALGVSRLLEWKSALNEVTIAQQSSDAAAATSSGGICQKYLLTNDDVDYDGVCSNPITLTLMSLKFDLSLQITAMIFFLVLKSWFDDVTMDRLNACLTISPVSTTLILLQFCNPFLEPSRIRSILLTCLTLAAVAGTATVAAVRAVASGTAPLKAKAITSQAACLFGLVGMQIFDIVLWWNTSLSSDNGNAANMSVLTLSPLTSDDWNDAWKVFMYTIMMDKLTVAVLCVFAFWSLENYKQRSFLLFVAMLKAVEYSMQLTEYNEDDFVNLPAIKMMAVASSIILALGWIAPF